MRWRLLVGTALLVPGGVVSTMIFESCASGLWSGNGYPSFPGLEIEFSSTRGATGLTTAHLLTGEGYVYRWQATERPESVGDPLGRAEPALMDSMAALVSVPGLLTEGVEVTGDMVRTLRVRIGNEEQRWSWLAGLSGRGTPEAVDPIVDLLREMISRAETSGSSR